MHNQEELQNSILSAEKAIREESRKAGIDFAELSPFVRELLARCYVAGGIDAIEKVKADQKNPLQKA